MNTLRYRRLRCLRYEWNRRCVDTLLRINERVPFDMWQKLYADAVRAERKARQFDEALNLYTRRLPPERELELRR